MLEFADIQQRVIEKVIEPQVPQSRRPVFPHHSLKQDVGMSLAKIRSMAVSLRKEFQPEGLDLSNFELEQFLPIDPTVRDLAKAVFERIKPYPKAKVEARVIGVVTSMVGPSAGTITSATKLQNGGLNLTSSKVQEIESAILNDILGIIRISRTQLREGGILEIGDWINNIVKCLKLQGR